VQKGYPDCLGGRRSRRVGDKEQVKVKEVMKQKRGEEAEEYNAPKSIHIQDSTSSFNHCAISAYNRSHISFR